MRRILATSVALFALAFSASNPANAAQSGQPDAVNTPINTTVEIDVLANDGNLGQIRGAVNTQAAHGTARWISGRIEYMPNMGYSGVDSFRYTVIGTTGRAVMQKVIIIVGGKQAVTLHGTATDSPLANALITADVGIARFQTSADDNGNYSLSIAGFGDTMVQLTAFGNGPQAQVQLRSTVGGISRIRVQAGDGVLTRDENNQVQVNQLSTAQAYLLYVANGSQDIANQDELDLVAGSIDLTALTQMAAAIKLVADGAYPLPPGIDDTYALISDPNAFAQFVSDVNTEDPTALTLAFQQTIADPDVRIPANNQDYFGSLNLISVFGAPGTVDVRYIQGNRVNLNPNGTGSFFSPLKLNPVPAVNWNFNGNVAHIVPVNPIEIPFYPTVNGQTVLAIETYVAYDLTLLYEGGDQDIYAMTQFRHVHYPDGQLPDSDETYNFPIYGLRDGKGNLRYTPVELTVPRAFRVGSWPSTPFDFGTAIFSFASDGTGTGIASGYTRSFNWKIDANGTLLVDYPDNGDTAAYVRVGNDGSYGDAVMSVFSSDRGFGSRFGASYVSDGFFNFSDVNLVQSWASGFDLSSTSVVPYSQFYVRLNGPGSTGDLFTKIYSDGSTTSTPLSWLIEPDETMMATNYWSAANGNVPFCSPPVVGVCEAYSARSWKRIAVAGNRIYVLEELYSDSAPYDGRITSNEVFSQRLNFYEASAP